MRVTTRFRNLLWTLKKTEFWGARVHIQCVSGTPQCGAVPPFGPERRTSHGALAWPEWHMRDTGHLRYDRALFETLQWDPPGGIDPRTLPGVTT